METSANLKCHKKSANLQITSSHSRRSPKHWYWKIVEEFRLKFTKFKHVDQLVRDDSSLTLVKGFTLGCIVYFYLFKASVSQNKRPQRFFPSLESPSWIPHGEPPDEIGRLVRVRNLCLIYLWLYPSWSDGYNVWNACTVSYEAVPSPSN